jgi:predicted HAD superfamily phosphohydrolase YqeG
MGGVSPLPANLTQMNSSKPRSPVYVFVDVDDTLVRSAGSKRIPMPNVINHVRELHAQGAILYCWSAGGAEYSRRTAEELGIARCFAAYLPKPNVMIDDLKPAEWSRYISVHPSNCRGHSLDNYRSQLD